MRGGSEPERRGEERRGGQSLTLLGINRDTQEETGARLGEGKNPPTHTHTPKAPASLYLTADEALIQHRVEPIHQLLTCNIIPRVVLLICLLELVT